MNCRGGRGEGVAECQGELVRSSPRKILIEMRINSRAAHSNGNRSCCQTQLMRKVRSSRWQSWAEIADAVNAEGAKLAVAELAEIELGG